MLLTISTTASRPTDLGHLLQKHPDRLHERELNFGTAHVFYPEVNENRCTAALAVEVDPVGLVRGSGIGEGYVSDRPYVAGSLLSVALGRTLSSALAGRAKDCVDRIEEPMPLEATLSALHCPGGETVIKRAFEPLGYQVSCEWHALDARFPSWGGDVIATITLRATICLRDLLRHIYILAPVLDGSKHYYVGLEEVDKLIRHGEGWLAGHSERDWIVRRYLRFKKALMRQAMARLIADDAERDEVGEAEEDALEAPARLNDQRLAAVVAALRDPSVAVRSVADLGCGEGRLLAELAGDMQFERILGLDVSSLALERAEERIRRKRLPGPRRERVGLILGSLVYRDERLRGFDAATLVEVIEHVDPFRLPAFERALFGFASPRRVIVTTPNAEYNVRWATLPAGRFRHRDHRFEWTREQFGTWARAAASAYGYDVRLHAVGPVDAEVGAPTQMALFDRKEGV
jgi:3' terminal RNA ribose 2'-O-methyltransferase Hen1